MDKLRFAIAGCGEIAVATAEGMAHAPHAQIVMAMDAKSELAEDMANRHQARATTSFEEVLSSQDVDAIYIATPHFLHLPMALAAAQAGKHVLLEKPMATNVADAKQIIEAFARNKVRLGIAFHAQVDGLCRRVRELVQAGVIGDVYAMLYVYLGDKPASYWHGGYTGRVQTDWRTSKEKAGGGVLIMNLIHDFNTVRYITGLEATLVFGQYGTFVTPVEVEDLAFATVRYANQAIGSIAAGSAIRGGSPGLDGDRIYGTQGQIVLGHEPRLYTAKGGPGLAAGEWIPLLGEEGTQRRNIVEGFAEAVLEDREPPVTGTDGLRALEIVEAVYRSSESGKPVRLPL